MMLNDRNFVTRNSSVTPYKDIELLAHLRVKNVTPYIETTEAHLYACGELSDVHKCNYLRPGQSSMTVAVKVLRGHSSSDPAKQSFREALISIAALWTSWDHPNIMKCFGICYDLGTFPGVVLPFCGDGNIVEFSRSLEVRQKLHMLSQAASGVVYLHDKGILHGDLRGANILISHGSPLVMDSGLVSIVSRSDFTTAGAGPVRWTAPEILDPPEGALTSGDTLYTTASDVFSLGMTLLEVLTGERPFSHIKHDTVVIMVSIRRELPSRPVQIRNDVWDLLLECWREAPSRPSASTVEAILNVIKQY